MLNICQGLKRYCGRLAIAIAAIAFCLMAALAYYWNNVRSPDVARVALTEVARALDLYFQDCKDFPSIEQGLDALVVAPKAGQLCEAWAGPYLEGTSLLDPWGRRFIYERDGAYYILKSHGKDGKPDGDRANADISTLDH